MAARIGILSSQRGFHALALEEAVRGRGCEPVFFNITRMAGRIGGSPDAEVRGEGLGDCRALLVRTIPAGSLEQIIFRMDILHRLERLEVPVVNAPTAIERTVDKYCTSFLLADAGIPTPRSLVTEDFEAALAACREMGDVVIKPLFGSEGKGMVRAADEETAYRVLRAWELNRYVYYIQEYVPHFRKDVRAFVVGGRVAAAMQRNGSGWKTNCSKGAEVLPMELSPEMESLALQAVRITGLDYAGVDLMQAEDGRIHVIEINSIPGWRALQKVTREDIPGLIVDHVLKRIHRGGAARSAEGIQQVRAASEPADRASAEKRRE
ncbi:MAG: RimK family alpha-L-glutamate ligase [Acidobacteria bacterium]|nr:RimK family alpha-L-glutamate ligase [Acidobacteriota bacterium]